MGAARTETFLGSRYHRIARHRRKPHAMLPNPCARFADLGPG